MTIYFANPTRLDPRLIGTFGVNVKPAHDSPIGYFGTGLKYALAVLLREGCTVHINGKRVIAMPEQIRGKVFEMVHLGSKSLGFTTDLGRNWGLRQAYRELYCNALDERGTVHTSLGSIPKSWRTIISVEGLEAVHAARFEFILDTSRHLLASTPHLDIYLGTSSVVFYKGIAALTLSGAERSRYTYNIKSDVQLTEDRTIAAWEAQYAVERAMAYEGIDPAILHDVLTAEDCFEARLDFTYRTPTPGFLDAIATAIKSQPLSTNPSARQLFYKTSPSALQFDPHTLSAGEAEVLEAATVIIERHFPNIRNYTVEVTKQLGDNVLGLALNGKIYLAQRVSVMPILVDTLFEEFVHLEFKVGDHTREMQDLLFNMVIKFMQGA